MSNRILITGSAGYIGTALIEDLHSDGYDVFGLDNNYFASSKFGKLLCSNLALKDLRSVGEKDLIGYKTIVHLAALSNDPLGELDEKLTYEINYYAAVKLAKNAKAAGVSKFIFASTQSIYGISDLVSELAEDDSKNPITAYAKSKWAAEQEILAMSDENFLCVAIRPSTVFGWGARIRNDIIFNNMIATGLRIGKIKIHSDGTPNRPIVHISDVVSFIKILINSLDKKISSNSYNVGMINGNYSVLEIAEKASECLNGVPFELNTENLTDQRSYRVNFDKARKELGFSAKVGLFEGGNEIISKFNGLSGIEKLRYFDKCIRITVLMHLIDSNQIGKDLRWI